MKTKNFIIRNLVPWLRRLDSRCHACGRRIQGGEGALLCPECEQELAPRSGGFCPGCGELYLDKSRPPYLCGNCRISPMPWDGFFFHGPYHGPLGALIRDYKFRSRLGLGVLLGTFLTHAYTRLDPNPRPDLIIPVPLHKSRLVHRGYNQSLEPVRVLARAVSRPLAPGALIRNRHTTPQTRLKANERERNLRGAFTADQKLVRGKTILLIDDIMTTGATLKESAKTLKRAGAVGLDVLVLARTGPA